MNWGAILCFVVVAVDLIMCLIRSAQGRETAYLYGGSAAIFTLLGFHELGMI